MSRFATDSRPTSAHHVIIEFYREEFIKHRRCLQEQRPYYSESAITDVEAALARIISELEQLSSQDDAPQLVSSLLKKIDVVTGLSAWTDPKQTH
jgi:hypothetical protein